MTYDDASNGFYCVTTTKAYTTTTSLCSDHDEMYQWYDVSITTAFTTITNADFKIAYDDATPAAQGHPNMIYETVDGLGACSYVSLAAAASGSVLNILTLTCDGDTNTSPVTTSSALRIGPPLVYN